MKRKTLHRGFALLTLVFAALAIQQWLVLERGQSITQLLKQPSLQSQSSPYADVQLAQANALSAAGDIEVAETAFNQLINRYKGEAIGRSAQFNLANLYLRQGMREDLIASRKVPLLELAKQRYRDLLRTEPNDWDARYNLERSLRLAPESMDDLANDKGKPIKSVRVIVPDFKARDLP